MLVFNGDPNATTGQGGSNVSIGGVSIGNAGQASPNQNCSSSCGGCGSQKTCYQSDGSQFATSTAQLISQISKQAPLMQTVQNNIQTAASGIAASIFSAPSANIFKVTGHSAANGYSIN
jgi:hypothetical protein